MVTWVLLRSEWRKLRQDVEDLGRRQSEGKDRMTKQTRRRMGAAKARRMTAEGLLRMVNFC
jgi:hypothetical protein